MTAAEPIPAHAHFVWIGARLPWIYGIALRSALLRGGFQRVTLHGSPELARDVQHVGAGASGSFELAPLAPESVFEAVPGLGGRLVDLYRALETPAARSNLLRIAILHREGGVYLDTDTVTVRRLDALRAAGGVFCGAERIAYPEHVRWYRPVHFAAALARDGARDALRRLPEGYRYFRRVERLYPKAVNNAVLGATASHPFLRELLERACEVPERQRLRRFELGTSLWQRAARRSPEALRVYEPDFFYPLGPEISEHWFRANPRAASDLPLSPNTHVVHWYASVRTRTWVSCIDAQYVREHQRIQPFSALAAPFAA